MGENTFLQFYDNDLKQLRLSFLLTATLRLQLP